MAKQLSGRLQQMKFMQRSKQKDDPKKRLVELQQQQNQPGKGEYGGGSAGANKEEQHSHSQHKGDSQQCSLQDNSRGVAAGGGSKEASSPSTPSHQQRMSADEELRMREEHWVLPPDPHGAASGAALLSSCLVIVESDPRPGALLGRMSFGSFNQEIEKITRELEEENGMAEPSSRDSGGQQAQPASGEVHTKSARKESKNQGRGKTNRESAVDGSPGPEKVQKRAREEEMPPSKVAKFQKPSQGGAHLPLPMGPPVKSSNNDWRQQRPKR